MPLLSPPNCPWGEKNMHSGLNFGNLSWCKNQAEGDGLEGGQPAGRAQGEEGEDKEKVEGESFFGQGEHMVAHGCTSFNGADMVAVFMQVAGRSVCLLVGSDLSAWHEKAIFGSDVSVFRMAARGARPRWARRPVGAAASRWAIPLLTRVR